MSFHGATSAGEGRSFLFLQGPHGPFFHQLAGRLRETGAATWRVGFNAGDAAFWPDRQSYIPFTAPQEDWPATLAALLDEKNVTDIVLYGDTRPIHAEAVARARARGLVVHVFEEGYLRPYWVTYERDGSNGNSALMGMSVAEMRRRLEDAGQPIPEAPAHWGDMRQHVFYGAAYHWFVMVQGRRYRNFRPHREITVFQEFRLHFRKAVLMPFHWVERMAATAVIRRGGFPYHLVLLQLEHDANFRAHSPFSGTKEFLDTVMRGFARGAPAHHRLVIKAHPLEDGRVNMQRTIGQLAALHGITGRVHFLRGGKLAALLDGARSAVTVNSTAAQQALWRGLPLKAFGAAVYSKPEFVSDQPMDEFFANPRPPDAEAYRSYRLFLLETSQLPGGFYSARGRRQLLREAPARMLAPHSPYEALGAATEAAVQQLQRAK